MDKRHVPESSRSSRIFDFFFVRPVPTTIWIFLLLFFGLVGFQAMVKEELPDLEIPEFYITTIWEGATPAMVEKELTKPLEKELRSMPGVKRLYSSSMYGLSIVAITFEADRSLDRSMQLVQRQVAIAQGNLPRDAQRPKIEAASVNDAPIVTVALSGEAPATVLEKLTTELKKKLDRISGIRRVAPYGARTRIIQVELNPERLIAFGVPATMVRETIKRHGADAPWGAFSHSDLRFTMRMDGAYDSLDELRGLVINRMEGGQVLRLGDVAEVRESFLKEVTRASLSLDGGEFAPVVALDLLKSPGQDTIGLVQEVRGILEHASASPSWPEGVVWRLVGSQADSIAVELERGFTNGWQAMLVVFAVLFILLSWREAMVAAISVPLTLLGATAVLWAMGYTFNFLVLVGMILALGLLVDDFILIMEGMHEAIFIKRMKFRDAVKRTIASYALPSFSGSVTTILVFVPLAFVGGVDGKFIRVIPVTAGVCLVMSYLVSVMLGPSMSRLFLGKGGGSLGPGFIDRLSHRVEQWLAGWLKGHVIPGKGRAMLWMLGALILFMISLHAAGSMRDTLYPKEDGRTLGITVELAADVSLEESQKVAERLSAILLDKPYFEHVLRIVGGKDGYSFSSIHDHMGKSTAPNIIGFGCFFTRKKEREFLAFEYVEPLRAELEAALAGYPGARIYMNPEIGGSSTEDALQIDITGDDLNMLRRIVRELAMELDTISGVHDIRDTMGPVRMELSFRPMHEAMDFYGVSQEELAGQMLALMENEKVAKFRRPGVRDDLDIRLGTGWEHGQGLELKDWDQLSRLSVINGQGRAIPLWSLADVRVKTAEGNILHKDGQRSATVLAKLDGIYVSEVLELLRPIMEEWKEEWPEGFDYSFAGEEDVEQTYRNMLVAFVVAIVLVYAVLALLFDSLLYPGIILSTVLFSLVGVFFGFILTGVPFSFTASIGIVALVGIVVNDAIIMIQTMRAHLRDGMDIRAAAAQGAADRLRPIVSTTVTNFGGLLPLALSDPGWTPLCQAIIYGELTATVGAVVLIPALFVLLTGPVRKKGDG